MPKVIGTGAITMVDTHDIAAISTQVVASAALQQLYDELDWLMGVTSHNFEMALSGNNEQHECLSRYLLGVFPSWERMPKWFGSSR